MEIDREVIDLPVLPISLVVDPSVPVEVGRGVVDVPLLKNEETLVVGD